MGKYLYLTQQMSVWTAAVALRLIILLLTSPRCPMSSAAWQLDRETSRLAAKGWKKIKSRNNNRNIHIHTQYNYISK
ncbi:hypothetical protein C8Q69DRAFT_451724 [Paecilomyces variotii]|uniref:Uncharacterized protein n=1 Tax=Byssochlamys spectabilis TaxID=264951 RepID=A0A443I6B5_BYSSP|nr:hypothetical protein C8Q69DRAFT_451724 [Paecilomyces variotii]RWQ99592.1 hypothetical protein C8Q69DRAFT_451724 [Paecilomyces variotii]